MGKGKVNNGYGWIYRGKVIYSFNVKTEILVDPYISTNLMDQIDFKDL